MSKEEVKKYGDVNQGLGTWDGYEYINNKGWIVTGKHLQIQL